jgi:hypothetical protein
LKGIFVIWNGFEEPGEGFTAYSLRKMSSVCIRDNSSSRDRPADIPSKEDIPSLEGPPIPMGHCTSRTERAESKSRNAAKGGIWISQTFAVTLLFLCAFAVSGLVVHAAALRITATKDILPVSSPEFMDHAKSALSSSRFSRR